MAELPLVGIKEMSSYCQRRRRDPEFEKLCRKCDGEQIEIARKSSGIHIYRCHSGLLEGVVPLHDQRRRYLGAIVFGQVRPAGMPVPPPFPCSLQKLFEKLPVSTEAEMAKIASLLKYLSEYILAHELIRLQNRSWADRLTDYIDHHLEDRSTLPRLARLIGKSTSFLNHNFKAEFGLPVAQYIRKRRMERAVQLLKEDWCIYEIAGQLGFYDEFHFSRAFKAHYGRAPSFFRGDGFRL
jgi:AraC-like DNA-binding protein